MSTARLFTCLVFLPLVAIASAETEPSMPFPTLPLEKYEDPPAPFPLLGRGVSPGMLSREGLFTSHQVNVDASGMNILGDAANETSIAVDPTNGNRMVIGWRQFNSVTSNFRQAGWGYTNDGGATWTFPGVLENNVFRSDPVLGCDDTGHFFYLSLLQSLFDDMWGSVNGGQIFTNLGPATGGDKQWFTIDNTSSSSGHGFQYQSWDTSSNYGTRLFSRSTDGGVTWMDPIDIPNSPELGSLDVDSNGVLFIAGRDSSTGQILCTRSIDARNGAVIPSFDQTTVVNLGGRITGSQSINPVGLIGQLFLAADRSGTSTNNNVYILASVQPTGFGGSDVMFVRSTDGGQTFSAPYRVNDDPVNHKWHWFGTLSVAPNGRIDSVWLDTRNAANNSDSQLFYSFSLDAGNTWSPNVAVSNSFNPHLGYPNQNKMGDYITMVSDNAGSNVAYTATFNQEEDVYYVRVAPGVAPTPTPSPTPTASPSPTSTPTATATATVAPSPTPTPTPTPSPTPAAQALNLSSRLLVQTDDNVGIGGFIITGTAPKQIVLRGLGPSLLSVPNRLADPVLELRDASGQLIASNDNWCTPPPCLSCCDAIIATGLAPTNDLESVILMTVAPGPYTAIISGKNNTSGVALVEIYDLSQAAASKLGNISTRAFVGTDADIVIAGLTLGGHSGNDNVIVRGLGPSLTGAGVPNALVDPNLELRDSNGALLITNNNWQDDAAQAAIIMAAGLAPTNPLESGIAAMALGPGRYTALLSGRNNGTGVGLVEVYDLGAP